MVAAITTAGWIFIGVVGAFFLMVLIRLWWIFSRNEPIDTGRKSLLWWRRKTDKEIMDEMR